MNLLWAFNLWSAIYAKFMGKDQTVQIHAFHSWMTVGKSVSLLIVDNYCLCDSLIFSTVDEIRGITCRQILFLTQRKIKWRINGNLKKFELNSYIRNFICPFSICTWLLMMTIQQACIKSTKKSKFLIGN
jgi:hypothetical protein